MWTVEFESKAAENEAQSMLDTGEITENDLLIARITIDHKYRK